VKVIVAGSRDIIDPIVVWDAIRESGYEITEVVSGRARGVDTLGEEWAAANGIPVKPFPVTKEEWRTIGKYAGHLRNRKMGDYGQALVAIWDGQSKGTRQMVEYMALLGKPYYVKVVER
jgi:hypothetical protein